MRSFFKKLNKLLQNKVSPDNYIWIARLAYPVFVPNRRGNKVTISREGKLFHAVSDQTDYYFDSHFKVGRYLYGPGYSIEDHLRDRYSNEAVKVLPGDTVIDVGANVGEFSRAVAKDAKLVIAIEPDPSPFSCLKLNARNHSHIHPLQSALGETLRRVRKIAVDASPERYGQSPEVECVEILERAGFEVATRNYMVFGINRQLA